MLQPLTLYAYAGANACQRSHAGWDEPVVLCDAYAPLLLAAASWKLHARTSSAQSATQLSLGPQHCGALQVSSSA